MSDEKDGQGGLGDEWAEAMAEQHNEESAGAAEADGTAPAASEAESPEESIDAAGAAEPKSGADMPAADKPEKSTAKQTKGQAQVDKGRQQAQQTVELDEFDPAATEASSNEEDGNIDVILDIPVTLSMEIGRTQISIRHLLQLNQGSVVELDRLAGEPLDVMVNGTLIAHGEVVVVNERFGIRLTDVISPAERVKKLR